MASTFCYGVKLFCVNVILFVGSWLIIFIVSVVIVLANATPNNFNPKGIARIKPTTKSVMINAPKSSAYPNQVNAVSTGEVIKSNNISPIPLLANFAVSNNLCCCINN